jgi:hypothetical protein
LRAQLQLNATEPRSGRDGESDVWAGRRPREGRETSARHRGTTASGPQRPARHGPSLAECGASTQVGGGGSALAKVRVTAPPGSGLPLLTSGALLPTTTRRLTRGSTGATAPRPLPPRFNFRSQPQAYSSCAQLDDRSWHVRIPLQVSRHALPMREPKDLRDDERIDEILAVDPGGHERSLAMLTGHGPA